MMRPATPHCGACGQALVRFDTDGMGRLVEVPAPCPCQRAEAKKPKRLPRTPAWRQRIDNDRRRACVCQLCDEPVTGKPKVALYCDAHREERRRETQIESRREKMAAYSRRYRERNREKINRKERARARRDRKKRAEYKRAWRKLNRDKTAKQKERAALRNFRDPAPGVRRWREEVAAGERTPTQARRNERGERLCLNTGCGSVMAGRAKKCEPCKTREAREAAAMLQRKAA